jgi:hypothetical protein
MAYQRVGTYYGNPWGNQIASIGEGFYCLFYPGNANVAAGDKNTLVLYGPDGIEVARQAGGIGALSLAVAPDGEIVATVTRFGENGVPVDRWRTGVKVEVAVPPPPAPPPSGNAAKIAALRELLTQAQALIDTLT